MANYKETNLKTGSPKPEKPVSHRTDGPAGGTSGLSYNPAGATKYLNKEGMASCAPSNDGKMRSG